MRRNLTLVIALLVTSTLAQLVAHHSFSAEFDIGRPLKLRGTVTKMEWVNPHAWLHLDVKGPDGKVVPWMIEAAAPNALLRRGFTKNSLPPGTEVIVEGFQAKDGSNTASGRHLTFAADGKGLFMSSSGTGEAPAAAAPAK